MVVVDRSHCPTDRQMIIYYNSPSSDKPFLLPPDLSGQIFLELARDRMGTPVDLEGSWGMSPSLSPSPNSPALWA